MKYDFSAPVKSDIKLTANWSEIVPVVEPTTDESPDTGDKTNLMFFSMTLLEAIAAIAGALYIKKKYEN